MNATRQEILDAISSGPVAGPDLADRLEISRAAVWKHVEALRDDGFVIDSDDPGYRLESIPEFGGTAVEFGCDAPFDVEYHDSIPSTNERARKLATEGATDRIVLADEQTAGSGRLDRSWQSPSGGIWLSMLLRPDVPPAHAPAYTLAAAVATTRAVRSLGVDAVIKWPNDVLVRSGDSAGATDTGDVVGSPKLAGILTEMEGEADRITWLVVGIGINANVDASSLPGESNATSISEQVGTVERRGVVQELLETFHELRGNLRAVLPKWREHASTLGQRVRVETAQGEIVGEAVDVTFPGTLIVDTGDERVEVVSGDCEHLRPAE